MLFEQNKVETPDLVFTTFPKGACGPASELIGRYLREAFGLNAQYVSGERADGWTHAWIVIDDLIIDITADQFGEAPVIVERNSVWHAQWETEPPREPITSQQQWPMHPTNTWNAILKGMAEHSYAITGA